MVCGRKATFEEVDPRAQELFESRGGRIGHPVPNSPCGLCGRKATLNLNGRSLEALFYITGLDCVI